MSKKYILEEDIFFTNKKIFKDENEYCYTCKCYDGVAICTPYYHEDDEEENKNLPMIISTYPKKKDVLKDNDLCQEILTYRGLYDLTKKQIHYGDIMMYLGKLTKVDNNAIELALQTIF